MKTIEEQFKDWNYNSWKPNKEEDKLLPRYSYYDLVNFGIKCSMESIKEFNLKLMQNDR